MHSSTSFRLFSALSTKSQSCSNGPNFRLTNLSSGHLKIHLPFFTHCCNQPRSQGFSLLNWVPPTQFKRQKPWERGCAVINVYMLNYKIVHWQLLEEMRGRLKLKLNCAELLTEYCTRFRITHSLLGRDLQKVKTELLGCPVADIKKKGKMQFFRFFSRAQSLQAGETQG